MIVARIERSYPCPNHEMSDAGRLEWQKIGGQVVEITDSYLDNTGLVFCMICGRREEEPVTVAWIRFVNGERNRILMYCLEIAEGEFESLEQAIAVLEER